MTTAIITMAGFGRRFLDAGYSIPKYRIEAHGRSLFTWSLLSLKSFIEQGTRFVFVVREADNAGEFIAAEAAALSIVDREIVELDGPTDGQATTVMKAEPAVIATDRSMLIYNIDTFVDPRSLPATGPQGDGWIPCFPAQGDHWSFAAADSHGRVREVREKVRISNHATIGLYWFSSFEIYAEAYRNQGSETQLEAGERYVAPLYNHLIAAGRPVYVHEVPLDAVIPLGLPSDVERFREMMPPSIAVDRA